MEGLNKLTWLDLAQNYILSDISALSRLNNLIVLRLDRNSISDISPLVENTGLGSGDRVFLEGNPLNSASINTHIPALQRRGVTVEFDAVIAEPVDILDSNLRAAIERKLGKASGAIITTADMARLDTIRLPNADIHDLTGLEHATNLRVLNMGAQQVAELIINNNSIRDISPLAGLNKLTELRLELNSIRDISPLKGLTNLEILFIWDNSISDISPLSGLNSLRVLDLSFNSISDISSLSGLTNLTGLGLESNSISNISPLSGLNNLSRLFLNSNSISDISPLVENTGLERGNFVNVRENPLNSASINTHIPALQRRGVTVEFDAVIAEPVDILDSNLRAAITTTLGKAPGTVITTADMATLTELEAPNADITDLTGLEHATNLTYLNLANNSISDISPLTNLTNLTVLSLRFNSISDISPLQGLNNLTELYPVGNSISDISSLANLTNLTVLNLGINSISDISPLQGLNNLTSLSLADNAISDISALAGLDNLEELHLWDNSTSDISALQGLNNLTYLSLWGNSISDMSPLVANTGLGNGDFVDVTDNPLNAASINTHIPALQRRGVTVEFDAVIAEPVNIPDPNLRAKIEEALGKASGDTITTADMADLTGFRADNANITDLTGLEYAINLTWLNLRFNSISDISRLAELTNLTGLYINNNPISDLSLLARLTNLESLHLGNNSISDLSPLAGLTNLTWLHLWGTSISDVSPLAGLTNLTELSLWGTSISDISPVAGFTNLMVLYLSGNSISDISAMASLTNLMVLYLSGNSISDISPLVGLTNLTELDLRDNSISDLSPLVENMGFREEDWVDVSENPLNSVSINTHIPALQRRGVTVEFDAVIAEPVVIPDPNLRAAIEAELGKASGATITTADMANLTELEAESADITDLTGLEHATNLTILNLGNNSISDISPVAELTNLIDLFLYSNSISNASPVEELTKLTRLDLSFNSISDILPVAGLTNLTELNLGGGSISDISPLTGLTQLTSLDLEDNSIADISSLSGLTNLTVLSLGRNSISDISPVAGLTNLIELFLQGSSISDISPLAGLTNLTRLYLDTNSISDISPLAGLTNLMGLFLQDNSISDISPLIANAGLGSGDTANVSENPLSPVSINTHIPVLRNRGVEVRAENLKPTISEYTLSIPAGISLIHVPLRVTEVDGVEQSIKLISDLYDALGGTSSVNFLITYDSISQEWRSYFVASDKGGPDDGGLTDDMGILVGLRTPVSVHLRGTALGANGNSSINLGPGLNLVGLPLNDSRINRVSDLFDLDGISGNVPVIILTDGGEFKLVGRAGDPGDIEITGGQAFIMTAQRAATVALSGDGWTNASGTAAAPPVTLKGIEVGDTTPVLGLRGAVVDQGTGLNRQGFRVTVKNLSTRKAVAAITSPDEAGYRSTVVDIETGRAAQIGDTLEISAQSPNPFIGVKPLRYTVTAEDVKQSLIQLPALVAYEIPAETQLLANYPNPFNPETWIPYRLAEDAFVTLTIYDLNGQSVRTLDVGHQIASVYENRSRAIYWDGRNQVGEQVASGVYFYHLSVGDYSATRKMVILK